MHLPSLGTVLFLQKGVLLVVDRFACILITPLVTNSDHAPPFGLIRFGYPWGVVLNPLASTRWLGVGVCPRFVFIIDRACALSRMKLPVTQQAYALTRDGIVVLPVLKLYFILRYPLTCVRSTAPYRLL